MPQNALCVQQSSKCLAGATSLAVVQGKEMMKSIEEAKKSKTFEPGTIVGPTGLLYCCHQPHKFLSQSFAQSLRSRRF